MSKNFDELKVCMKVVNTEFNVIGLCETHLKDKPNDYLNLPGYNTVWNPPFWKGGVKEISNL